FPYNLSPSHLKTFSAQTTKGAHFSERLLPVVPHLEAPAAGERGSGGADGWMNCGWWKSLLHVHILLEKENMGIVERSATGKIVSKGFLAAWCHFYNARRPPHII
ncbi:Thioredoxin H4-1, partial [Dissostichus eleginoides]